MALYPFAFIKPCKRHEIEDAPSIYRRPGVGNGRLCRSLVVHSNVTLKTVGAAATSGLAVKALWRVKRKPAIAKCSVSVCLLSFHMTSHRCH